MSEDGCKLTTLLAEVERLTAERDAIRGIVGHPGTSLLPEDAPLPEVVRVTHHQWLASQQASNQRILAEQGRADRAESERDAARAEGASLAIQLQACQDALAETIHDAGENGRERDAAIQRAEVAERLRQEVLPLYRHEQSELPTRSLALTSTPDVCVTEAKREDGEQAN